MSRINVSRKKNGSKDAPNRALCALGFSLMMTSLSAQVFANCEYTVTNQWNDGFTASIKITNTGSAPVNSWNINWQYVSDNRITNSWNTTLTGANPYAATGLSWNSTLAPNQSAEFGFQGTKGSAAAEVPKINGALCNSVASSVASSKAVSSIAASSKSSVKSSAPIASSSAATSVANPVSSIPRSSSSAAVTSSSTPTVRSSSSVNSSAASVASWNLDTTASYLNFVTTKNTHTVEVHSFAAISGDISSAGVATLSIDLNSVNTGIALRDQRMRDLLFQTTNFPTATVTLNLPANLLGGIAIGDTSEIDLPATLDLHGISTAVQTRVSVQKLSASRVLVQSLSPVLVKAADYSLTAGVEALRAAVGIASISAAVPVDFALVFEAR